MGSSKPWITPFLKQCFVTSGVCLNMASQGLVLGFTTTLEQQLSRPGSIIPIDSTAVSWIAAIPAISLFGGNFIAPPTMARYGRRTANLVTIVPMTVGWISIHFARSITILLVGRFLQGLSMGMCTPLSSLLIGEYTSPKYRGPFLMTITISIGIAVMTEHCLGSFLSWQTAALICTSISIVDLFIVLYSPESPSWLARQGRYEDCKKSFRWLRGDEEEEELESLIKATTALKEAEAETSTNSWIEALKVDIEYFRTIVKKREFLNPIIIMIHFYFLGQYSGINMLVAFLVDLLQKIVGKDCNIRFLVITLDAHRIVANTTALFVINKVKRRTILVVTVCINILALLANASYCYAKENGYISSKEFALGISLVHIHMFAIATGALPLCFIIAGEIFPLEYRSIASGITVSFFSMNYFITMKTVPFLLNTIHLYGLFVLYACIMAYSFLVVWYLLPETKDRTLQDIEDEFRGRPLSHQEFISVQSLKAQSTLALHTLRKTDTHPVVI